MTVASAEAQVPGASSLSRCSKGGAVTRLAAGSLIGGWVGFVAAKIKVSDWDDGSGGSAAHRMRNRATIGGAVLGAAVTGIFLRSQACGTEALPAPRVRRGFEPITALEIQRSGLNGNVYELVYSRRRNWLNLRGIDALTEGTVTWRVDGQDVVYQGETRLVVYLDNAKLGAPDQLRELPITGVAEVRFYDGPEATYKWGAGHIHGVIQVLTSQRP